jgi:hypothetical protein
MHLPMCLWLCLGMPFTLGSVSHSLHFFVLFLVSAARMRLVVHLRGEVSNRSSFHKFTCVHQVFCKSRLDCRMIKSSTQFYLLQIACTLCNHTQHSNKHATLKASRAPLTDLTQVACCPLDRMRGDRLEVPKTCPMQILSLHAIGCSDLLGNGRWPN